MKDLKTTIPGAVAGIAQIVKMAIPQWSMFADLFTALSLAAMGFFAKDAK